jgi:glutamine cyclotransferase
MTDKFGNQYKIAHFWGRGNTDYTQGLKYKDGQLLESTGIWRQSRLQYQKFNTKSNLLEAHTVRLLTDRSDFGEGCDVIKLNDSKDYAFQ